MKPIRLISVLSFVFLFMALPLPVRAADGVIQPPCNQDAFDIVLNSVQASGGGTLTFNCGAAATIIFSTTKIITTPVTILGEGKVTLSGGNAIRLFDVNAGGILALDNVTITAGYKGDGNGGAILNYYGEVYIQNSRFIANQTGPDWSGGAIENFGTLTITGSEFADNRAGNGGALFLRTEDGDATINNTTFRENKATNTTDGFGGAIFLWDGADLFIQDSKLEFNRAENYGGAIENGFQNSSMELINVEIVGNFSGFQGGGIYNAGTAVLTGVTIESNYGDDNGGGISSAGTLILTDASLNGNKALMSTGGGIKNTGSATLTNVTLSGNHAYENGGAISNWNWIALKNVTLSGNSADKGGGVSANDGFIFLENTVIAGSIPGGNCFRRTDAHLFSQGFNLSDDFSCSTYFNQGGDRNNQDAMLGPLVDNGGPTLTHLPAAGSPLVDGGQCQAAIPTDQRGISRPQGAACDIGAVERRAIELTFFYLPVVLR